MGTGYSRSPLFLKGALIELTAPLLVPVPNIILFQYNPETVTRQLTAWQPAERREAAAPAGEQETTVERNGRVQPYDPRETINLTLILDATDGLEEPLRRPSAIAVGVADALAALERLLYPIGGGGGALSVSVDVSVGAAGALTAAQQTEIQQRMTPVILFAWGPGRIIPVRVTGYSVTEKSFNQLLYPIRAEVALGLQVLTAADFEGDTSTCAEIARFAYKFTRTQQDVLALTSVANVAYDVVTGLLPL